MSYYYTYRPSYGYGYGYGYGYHDRYRGYYGYGNDPYYSGYGTLSMDPTIRNLCLTTPIRFGRAQDGFGPNCYTSTNTWGANAINGPAGMIVIFALGMGISVVTLGCLWFFRYRWSSNWKAWNTGGAVFVLLILLIMLIVSAETKTLYNNLQDQFPSVLPKNYSNKTATTSANKTSNSSTLTDKEPESKGFEEYKQKVKSIDDSRALARIFYIILLVPFGIILVFFLFHLNRGRTTKAEKNTYKNRYNNDYYDDPLIGSPSVGVGIDLGPLGGVYVDDIFPSGPSRPSRPYTPPVKTVTHTTSYTNPNQLPSQPQSYQTTTTYNTQPYTPQNPYYRQEYGYPY